MMYNLKNNWLNFIFSVFIITFSSSSYPEHIDPYDVDHDKLDSITIELCNGDFQILSSSGTCDTVTSCDAHRLCVQSNDPACAGQITACANPTDFDCDGITDAVEFRNNTDPTDPSKPGPEPLDSDSDGVANNCDLHNDKSPAPPKMLNISN